MKKVTLLSLVVAGSLYAATTLSSVKFDGLVYLSPEMASELIDIKAGDTVNVEKINEAVKLLHKQGFQLVRLEA